VLKREYFLFRLVFFPDSMTGRHFFLFEPWVLGGVLGSEMRSHSGVKPRAGSAYTEHRILKEEQRSGGRTKSRRLVPSHIRPPTRRGGVTKGGPWHFSVRTSWRNKLLPAESGPVGKQGSSVDSEAGRGPYSGLSK